MMRHRPPTFAPAHSGFTLLEVLIAMTLLALLMAMAFGSLRGAIGITRSGERTISGTNQARTVQEFLRRQLSHAMAIPFERMEDTGENRVFEADRNELRFVAPMPGHLANGGPHVQWITIAGDQLLFDHAQLNGYDPDDPKANNPRDPVLLIKGFSEAWFEYRGLDEAGELGPAMAAFEDAYRYNPELSDALVWSGRVALELGQPNRAANYWRQVLSENPTDERAAYFLKVAESQLRWGVAAGGAYYEGQAAYAAGDLEAALAAFLTATQVNGRFVDAWVWAARSSQELRKPREAIDLWQEVLRLDPSDERARWFLQAAQQELAHGPEAGRAFAEGLEEYQQGDTEAAQELFERAVEAEPAFAMAWGYLGRISFQAGDYQAAADAYGRATELEPDNDDYAFFATEAARLAEAQE